MRTRTAVGVLALALLIAVASVNSAFAQANLPENHYKVYLASSIPLTKYVVLEDQFGSLEVTSLFFEKFATPAEKVHSDGTRYPMYNPDIHMDWWRISYPQPSRTIIGTDQFGLAPWVLGDATYVLVPSLKNAPPPAPPIPAWNHYVCYEAVDGPAVFEYVTVIDQFFDTRVQVLQAKYFCNPAQKRADGVIYPIVDPVVHLACYWVQSLDPGAFSAEITTVDQFGYWQQGIGGLLGGDCLCVPALKDHPVRLEESTWGRVKALYRN